MTTAVSRLRLTLAALSAAALLAACGGGSDPGSVSPSEARSARASAAQGEGGPSQASATRAPNGAYVVQLADSPVTAYDGSVKGYAATKPKKGQKIDPNSPAVVNYLGYLTSKHDAALAGVGGGKKLYSYGYVFNGFAAVLTEEQAQKLQAMRGVLSVNPDEMRQADTSSTPAFLGLSGADGFWAKTGVKGEGVIIGIIDSGIWPEHPSFSDRTDLNGNGTKDGKLGYQQIPGWHGKCQVGEAWVGTNCNQKLIGARYFNEGQGGNAGIKADRPWEFVSARDYHNHGTHTASTAGGNANVPATGQAAVFGAISGMAPRARIAAYKALWSTQSGDTASGTTSDLVAAIDAAVADGVDVINYSISGSTENFRDAAEIAFLYAADAGVFVAASAGNSGPTVSTVAHPSPWITTVAAGTHNRNGSGSVTLGNGATYSGASVATAAGPAPLIAASDAGLPGVNASQLALCYGAADGATVLDPAKVAGKIVVCDRGVTARVNKSLAVQQAGGVGMILANTAANSLNADFHSVPTVHVSHVDRAPILAYAATPGATATINKATIDYSAPAPFTASFSSRGPLKAGGGDLLKPDIIAPGQDILAGVSPAIAGKLFDLLSGTSMSSPHIAGIAALFKEAKPGWSPMAIKSALMTSAGDVLDGPNTNPLVIFRQGAGHVRPSKALDPGLVFDSGWTDWISFICAAQGSGLAGLCAGYPKIDPSDLNMASIAIGDMAGVQTVKRKVTNVGTSDATYSASYTGMGGFSVTLPGPITIGKGETKVIEVSFLRTVAALNGYTGGQLTLTDGTHVVRVPMVVRPVALAAPTQVSANGSATSYKVTFGYDGAFSATPRGLVPAAVTPGTVADDPTDGACSLASPNAQKYDIELPLGTTYARFELFDADVNPGSDIDMCVFNSIGNQVGSSGSGTSAEQVNLGNGTLDIGGQTVTVVIQGWGVAGSTPFKLHTWLLGVADNGNMTVSAPAAATTGTTGNISLSFSGLTAGTKYLGSVAYGGAASLPNPTIVRVDP